MFSMELIVLVKCLDWLVTLKREPRKVKIRTFEFESHSTAHNGSAFDRYVVLNSLSNWHRKVNYVKNGKGIISLKIFN